MYYIGKSRMYSDLYGTGGYKMTDTATGPWIPCPDCKGRGQIEVSDVYTLCGGFGNQDPDHRYGGYEKCRACHGSGRRKRREPCTRCGGAGVVAPEADPGKNG
jgi:RecJ-like exonuclease